jgi:hypothetical protein
VVIVIMTQLPPLLAGSYVSLFIPKLKGLAHHTLPPCRLGTQNSQLELVGWLRVLPDDYVGHWGTVKGQGPYTDLLHISVKRNNAQGVPKITPLFSLRFEPTFVKFELRVDCSLTVEDLLGLTDMTTRVAVSSSSDYNFQLNYSIGGKRHQGSSHPWSLVNARAEKHGPHVLHPVPPAVRVILNPTLSQTYEAIREDAQARKTFSALLAGLTGGIVKTVIVPPEKAVDKMEEVEDGCLFAVYCVFPWVVDLLLRNPKCVMTDSTFKAVRPYTLAILHLIFANESMPIGFAVSPSETAESYIKLYKRVLKQIKYLKGVFTQSVSPPAIPPSCQNDLGETPQWPDEVPSQEEVEDDPVLDQTAPEEQEEEDLEFPLGDFRGVPKEITVLPEVPDAPETPTGQKISELNDQLLLGLPVITDQGAALKAFVQHFKLQWKLCHRHIIEAIGADGRMADWVVRILRCFSRKEFLRVRKTVLKEMHKVKDTFSEEDHAYIGVLRLLGLRPNLEDPLSDIRCWALWLRLGCPRTTNSAESVNGHLNSEIKPDETWIQRVFSVAKHLKKRYDTRYIWHDRSLRRNRLNCYPDQAHKACWSEGRTVFYQHLHDAFGKDWGARSSERFAPERRQLFFPPVWRIRLHEGKLKLPAKCQVQDGIQSQKALGDEGPSKLVIHQASAHTVFARLGWQISWSLWKQLGPRGWDRYGQTVNSEVIAIGTELGLNTDRLTGLDREKVTSTEEAEWRSRCWDKLSVWTSGK